MDTIVTAIRALLIQPDNTFEIREIDENLRQLQSLVGGYIEPIYTEHATLWVNEEPHDLPINPMATYLWWKLRPEMEGVDHLRGTCFVTGPVTDPNNPNITPCLDIVIDLYERMEAVRAEEEDGETPGEPSP